MPYEQIKPHVARDLHKPPHKSKTKEEIELQEEPCQSTCQAAKDSNEIPKAQPQASCRNMRNKNDVVCCGEGVRKKRPIGPLPVTPALKHQNVQKRLPVIESGDRLTDEHIDNAQAILAQNFRTSEACRQHGFSFQRSANL